MSQRLTLKVTRRQHAAKLRNGDRAQRRVSRWTVQIWRFDCGTTTLCAERAKVSSADAVWLCMNLHSDSRRNPMRRLAWRGAAAIKLARRRSLFTAINSKMNSTTNGLNQLLERI